jgi:hypothetical protein
MGRWLIGLVGVSALFVGCTSVVTLQHATTGKTVACGPYYMYGLHSFMAAERERQCIADYQRQGYERVPTQ